MKSRLLPVWPVVMVVVDVRILTSGVSECQQPSQMHSVDDGTVRVVYRQPQLSL